MVLVERVGGVVDKRVGFVEQWNRQRCRYLIHCFIHTVSSIRDIPARIKRRRGVEEAVWEGMVRVAGERTLSHHSWYLLVLRLFGYQVDLSKVLYFYKVVYLVTLRGKQRRDASS